MQAKIVEALSGMCWCKFLVARLGPEELKHPSAVDEGRPVLVRRHPAELLVLDIETAEGALFCPGGSAPSDLRKHQIWVSALFAPFLDWLYEQHEAGVDLMDLPDLVELTGGEQVRPEGPLDELLKLCLRSDDKEMKALARVVWQGTHEEGQIPLGTPPILADVKRWVGANPDLPIILT